MNDAELNARHSRRLHAEDLFLERQEKLEKKAAPLIGELCRNGQTVYYINLANGKVKESTKQHVLVEYLRRNNYI